MRLGDNVAARTVNNFGIKRVRRDVAVLDHAYRMPVAKGDFAVVAAARNADRPALLLSGAQPIREGRRNADVVKLRGRLVVPGTPCLAAIDRNDDALVTG